MPESTPVAMPNSPPPRRTYRYSLAPFLKSNASAGVIADAFGLRTVVSPIEMIASITDALNREVGDASGEILHKIGAACGIADMRAFMDRAVEEFGAELPKVHMGVALHTWWWPWSQSGWGRAAFDLQRAAQRLVRIDVTDSAIARAQPSARRPACDLLAGIFSGAFGRLSGREVGCVEVSCKAAGGSDCRFLVTTRSRAASAIDWRESGVSADEIELRIAEAAKELAS